MSWIQYWAYYDVSFHSLTDQIRGALGQELPSYYEAEMNPHITIHPRVQFKRGQEEKYRHYLKEFFPSSIQVNVTDFYFHPDEHKPFVICLDVQTDIPFQKRQHLFTEKIERNGGRSTDEPSPPHVTLYKSNEGRGKTSRNIPPNINQIKTRCRKFGQEKLPITVKQTKLRFEPTP